MAEIPATAEEMAEGGFTNGYARDRPIHPELWAMSLKRVSTMPPYSDNEDRVKYMAYCLAFHRAIGGKAD